MLSGDRYLTIPTRTSISVGLRIIPPTAGLARSGRKPRPTIQRVGHHIQPGIRFKVVKDRELEREIAEWSDNGHP